MPVGVGSGGRELVIELFRTGRVSPIGPFWRSLWDGGGRVLNNNIIQKIQLNNIKNTRSNLYILKNAHHRQK